MKNFRKAGIVAAIILFAAVAVTFTACEKEDKANAEIVNSEYNFKFKNGFLWFETEDDLFRTMDILKEKNETEVVEWLNEIGHTNSLLLNYYGNEDEPQHLLNIFKMSKYYAALMSSDGLLAAGNAIVLLNKDAEYVITNGDVAKVKHIQSGRSIENDNILIKSNVELKYGTTNVDAPNVQYTFDGTTCTASAYLKATIYWWDKHFKLYYALNDPITKRVTVSLNYKIKERDGNNKCDLAAFGGLNNFSKTHEGGFDESTEYSVEFWNDNRGGCFCWDDAVLNWTITNIYDEIFTKTQYFNAGCRE